MKTLPKILVSTALAAVLGALTLPAAAQDYTRYYTVVNAGKFKIDWRAAYEKSNELTAETQKKLPHYLDIAYGEDRKQVLDIYVPKEPVKNAPVLLFLHGGGFREGDKSHYGYIAEPLAKHGIVTVIASYRLTSDGHKYPAQADDVKAAILWINKNIAQYGGDGNSIYVSGHSAGAILSADVGVDRSWLEAAGVSRDILKGIAPISAGYEIKGEDRDDFAPTDELKRQASPIHHVNDPAPIAVIAYGGQEPHLKEPSEALEKALKDKGIAASIVYMDDEDHKDTVLSLGNDDSNLVKAILKMIEDGQK